MELTLVGISAFFGPVDSFSLPQFDIESSVDASDHSLHNSLLNSSINSFEFSLNLSSVTLGGLFLLLLLVIYLFRNLSQALLVLDSKLNNLTINYGKNQRRVALQI